MSELKPLNIVDGRTPEQVRADGDERWPDGRPYIKDGVCCVCCKPAPEPNHVCLIKLKEPEECAVHDLYQEPQRCDGLAYWTTDTASMCDECILGMLERMPDNREWLAPALADIQARREVSKEERLAKVAYEAYMRDAYVWLDGSDFQWSTLNPDTQQKHWIAAMRAALVAIQEKPKEDPALRIGALVRILAAGELQGQQGTVYNHLPSRPAPWHVRPDGWPEDEAGIAYMASELELVSSDYASVLEICGVTEDEG